MAYDVVVVGGGVVGLSSAYHLVRAGARVLLIDRGDAGRATDAGAGILAMASDTDHPDPYYRFVAHAAEHYPWLIERLLEDGGGETGYAVCGRLTVAVDEQEVAAFKSVRAHLARPGADGLDHEEMTPDEARARFPPLGAIRGAIWCPRDARVDGRLLAASLKRAAETHGLEVLDGEAAGFRLRGDRVRGVAIGGDEVETGHVVIAAGAWSAAFGPAFEVKIPIAPQRGQIAHLDLPDTDTRGWPIVSSFGSHNYMVAWDDSRVAAGATRETGAGFAPGTTVEGIMEVLSEAVRVAPGLRQASLREVRVGLRPVSADGRPILGPVRGMRNVLLATGHGPSGLQLGPYSGKLIAEAITGDEAVDFGPLGLERFL